MVKSETKGQTFASADVQENCFSSSSIRQTILLEE